MIRKAIELIAARRSRILWEALISRIYFSFKARPLAEFKTTLDRFNGKKGLEIGGPSRVFEKGGFLPIYGRFECLDMLNFSMTTVWTGPIELEAGVVMDGKRVGRYHIMEGGDLSGIAEKSYDFVLSSNNLEHLANPLMAIEQWLRVLRPGGALVLVVPRKQANFDHNRNIVEFDHLMADYRNKTGEDDLTHLDEILKYHDLAMDEPAGSPTQFKARSLKNFENRCLHHHVFDLAVLNQIFNHFNLSILLADHIHTDYVIIGQVEK